MTFTLERIKYIVGIDFGHGETAAWIVPIAETDIEKVNGYALLLKRSNEIQLRTIPSEVYYKDGVYGIDNKVGSSIITQMKKKVKDLKTCKECKPFWENINCIKCKAKAYKNYIRCVVEKLLELNEELDKNKRNFILCMASPTSWSEIEKKEYLNFFNEAIADLGLRFEWIINESDAAFFSKNHKRLNDEGCTLVIDYGSSTIDFTLMKNGIKVSDDLSSDSQHGAHCIEECMINAGRNHEEKGHDPNFEQTLAKTNEYFSKNSLKHIDTLEWVKHQCRGIKENYYTNYSKEKTNFDVDYKCALQITNIRDEETRRLGFNWYADMDEITKEYCNDVKNKFEEIHENILQKNGNKEPDKIILSGGASIMYWVKPLVKEIFRNSEINEDKDPSFVVAKGVALYARAHYKAMDDLVKKIGSEDYASMYKKADAEATRSALSILCNPIIENIKSFSYISANDIRTKFIDIIRGLDTNPEFCTLVHRYLNNSLSCCISGIVQNAIKTSYNIDLKKEDIKIDEVNTITMGFDSSWFKPGGKYYEKISEAIRYTVFVPIWLDFNWTKNRYRADATNMAQNAKKEICQYKFEYDTVYKEEVIDSFANQIKEIAVKEAIRIFYEKQLFTTTFSA